MYMHCAGFLLACPASAGQSSKQLRKGRQSVNVVRVSRASGGPRPSARFAPRRVLYTFVKYGLKAVPGAAPRRSGSAEAHALAPAKPASPQCQTGNLTCREPPRCASWLLRHSNRLRSECRVALSTTVQASCQSHDSSRQKLARSSLPVTVRWLQSQRRLVRFAFLSQIGHTILAGQKPRG